jgi:hypothetical protein
MSRICSIPEQQNLRGLFQHDAWLIAQYVNKTGSALAGFGLADAMSYDDGDTLEFLL